MTKYITYITVASALIFSLDVSAQARASVSASVTIVEVAGNSFTNNDVNTGEASSIDSFVQIASAKEVMRVVNADKTANLGKLTIMGGAAAYSITLPGEPIILSRLSGTELLTIQSLELATSKNGTDVNSSLDIIAICSPGKTQAPGYYSTDAPVDIVISYN